MMNVPRHEIVDYLRGIHARPGGTPAVLNIFRAGEVRGGADIMLLSELVSDPRLRFDLARHAMDEARHAYLLVRRMGELGCTPARLPEELDRLEGLSERSRARDIKRVYADRGSVGEAEALVFMTVALIPEQDATVKLRLNYDALENDTKTRDLLGNILRDEERHVAYLSGWLERFEQRFSRRAVQAARERLEDTYRRLDLAYYGSLQQYFDRQVDRAA
jgi:uncharacterized ferritin-like protein (DUF455 family)